jgi:hypothetical protein
LGQGAVRRTTQEKLRDIVSVKDFGAVGDGVVDDYAAVQAACRAIQAAGGGTLYFPKGVYFINQHKVGGPTRNGVSNFVFDGLAGLAIEGNGSKLVMQGGWVRTADYFSSGFSFSYRNCVGMTFDHCSRVSVRNLEMDGGASTITKLATAEGKSHGMEISGCTDVSIDNVKVHHFCADGLYLDASGPITNLKQSKRILVSNSQFINNARQGMSIIQCRYAGFINCQFSYTGMTGLYGGHSPQSGVDIEPNYYPGESGVSLDDYTGDLTFIGCSFEDNVGCAFVGTSPSSTPYPVRLDTCVFNNTRAIASRVLPATKFTTISNCSFNNVSFEPGYGVNQAASNVLVSRCLFNHSLPDLYCILDDQGSSSRTITMDGCAINLVGSTASTVAYRLWLTGKNCSFTGNKVFVGAKESRGTTSQNIIQLLVGINRDNIFDTDLSSVGSSFHIHMGSSTQLGNVYRAPMFLAPMPRQVADEPGGSIRLTVIDFANYSTHDVLSLDVDSSAPTFGTYAAGSRRFNRTPAVGQPKSWVCTVAGTPGLWVSEGNL